MIRLAGLLFAVVLTFAVPAVHAKATDRETDADTAARVFWKFARCAVERRAESSRELLESYTLDRAEREASAAFAQKHSGCLMPGDKLTMNENLFIGALAGAYFVKRHKGAGLPDYSALPPLVDDAVLRQETNIEIKSRGFLLMFGDCVFRNRPEEVRSLLETRPATEQERLAFDTITPVLGHCLPAEEGAQLKFSRINLRSILGEAAYKVDSRLSVSIAPATKVIN